MRVNILTLIVVLCSYNIYAQVELREYIGPSPSASNLLKFGEYTVDHSTGQADINIPLYEVKISKLSLPIIMRFNSTGRKVADAGSQIGIGWVLSTGACVTRVVRNVRDEGHWSWTKYVNESYPFTNLDGNTSEHLAEDTDIPRLDYEWFTSMKPRAENSIYWGYYLGNLYPLKDSEYDVFSYNLPSGTSGHFILKDDGNGKKEVFTIPYQPIKIELPDTIGTYLSRIEDFVITDLDGTRYYYGKGLNDQVAFETKYDKDDNYSYYENNTTAWYLCSMESADRNDVINIEYEKNESVIGLRSQRIGYREVYQSTSTSDGTGSTSYDDHGSKLDYHIYINYIPKKISYNGGSVYFENQSYIEERSKYKISRTDYLSKMSVISSVSGDTVKKVKFYLDKEFESENILTQRLDSIEIFGNSTTGLSYKFDYYNYTSSVDDNFLSSQDYWGYYGYSQVRTNMLPVDTFYLHNGSNPTITTKTDIPLGYSSQLTKRSYLSAMRQGMLKSIVYPTGGSTEFIYELHKGYDADDRYMNEIEGGGLRIKTIINKSGEETYETDYSYDLGVIRPYNVCRKDNFAISVLLHSATDAEEYANAYCSVSANLTYGTNFLYSSFFGSNYISYPHVEESQSRFGKKVYDYYVPYAWDSDHYYMWINGLLINKYSRYLNTNIEDKAKSNLYLPKYISVENDWHTPKIKSEIIENEEGEEVYKKEYYYNKYRVDTVLSNVSTRLVDFYSVTTCNNSVEEKVEPEEQDRDNGSSAFYDNSCSGNSGHTNYIGVGGSYGIGTDKFVSEKIQLIKTVESYIKDSILYNGSYYEDWLNKETYFEYDTVYQQLSRSISLDSDNSKGKSTEYIYSYEYEGDVYDSMEVRNILVPIIESRNYVFNSSWDSNYNLLLNDLSLREVTRTNYQVWNNDDNQLYPASVQKSINENELETRLEYHSYDNYGNVLSVSRHNDFKNSYIWGYNGKYPIAKIENANYSQVNLAVDTAQVHALSNADNDHGVRDSGTHEDALRTALDALRDIDGALVTTYTYDPPIGMTSETDPNGRTTYYEYDDFGRLKYIRDQYYNIIKKYEYKYVSQTE